MSAALRVDCLSFIYAGRAQPSLIEISVSIEPGSLVLLAGRSGSGKSTLLRAMAGLIPRHSAGVMGGRVLLSTPPRFAKRTTDGSDADDGRQLDTRHATPRELAHRVGLVLQSADEQLCATSVAGEIAFGLENLGLPPHEIESRIAAAIEQFGLEDGQAVSPQQLSGGQKQRLLLAAFWAMRPGVLLLDEPLSQLDAVAAQELLDEIRRLREQGWAMVIAEHRLDQLLLFADRLCVLDGGRLMADVCTSDAPAVAAALQQWNCLSKSTSPGDDESFLRTASVPHRRQTAAAQPLLSADGLGFQFPRTAAPLFTDVTFTIERGERVALVGPNGGGKSTLLAIVAGLLEPSLGNLQMYEPCDRSACGLLLQNVDLTLFCASVYDELAFGPRQLGWRHEAVHEQVLRIAEQLNIAEFLDQPPLSLSQGQRLRVALAATLTLRPRLLLLDEPTTGQDPEEVDRVLTVATTTVARGGGSEAVVLSTHDLRTVSCFADRVLVLAEGRLLADCSPSNLLADDALLTAACLRRWSLPQPRASAR